MIDERIKILIEEHIPIRINREDWEIKCLLESKGFKWLSGDLLTEHFPFDESQTMIFLKPGKKVTRCRVEDYEDDDWVWPDYLLCSIGKIDKQELLALIGE